MLAWVLHPPTLQFQLIPEFSKVPPIISKAMNIQHHLLVISWEGRAYMDRALPSGLHFFSPAPITHHVYSDACWGCGVVVERVCWFQMPWPQELLEVDISLNELIPVTIAAAPMCP